jgi:hypothetical protein
VTDAHLVVVARRSIDSRWLSASLEHGDEVSMPPIRSFCERERRRRPELAAADDEHGSRRSRTGHDRRVSKTSGSGVEENKSSERLGGVGKQRLRRGG